MTAPVSSLVLPVGGEWHAVPMASVREVLPLPVLTPVPASPPWLAGLANVRGEILAAVDTGAALGRAGGRWAATHLVVVDAALGPVALLTAGIPEAAELDECQGEGLAPGSNGRFAFGDRVATLLDVDGLTGAAVS